MKKLLFLIIFPYLLINCKPETKTATEDIKNPQTRNVNKDPNKALLVTSDVDNFWNAFDKAYDTEKQQLKEDAVTIFDTYYLKKGSEGLKQFAEWKFRDSLQFTNQIEKYIDYYLSARESTLAVTKHTEAIRDAYRKFDNIYPEAVFPNTYFVIGILNSGGTISDEGLLIGTEMYGRTEETPVEILSDWHNSVIKPIENISYVTAHESIHYNQKLKPSGSLPDLLSNAIVEGAADFISKLISGGNFNNSHIHEWANKREAELWKEFKEVMYEKEAVKDWMYNSVNAKDKPADLGYYMGYKIVEHYYNNTSDKAKAIRDILELENASDFLKKSNYASKFGE
ncbi:DUF2268 domain-containing putative Zn-dependent protease [Leptobacterium sp. I13]|uniref:gliding motility protein GldB-related protein n=1 Tax=Leptobacterium meishanense TaxID=3128904 RepID=UPI0030ECD497